MNLNPKDRNYKDEFNIYWLPKICDEFGNLDNDKVARELFDYNTLYKNVAEIMNFLTNGQCTNPFLTLNGFLEYYNKIIKSLINVQNGTLAEELAIHILKDPKNEKDIGHNECLKDIINYLTEKSR